MALASTGAHVVLLCRDASRGQAALEEVRARSGNANTELALADLSSLDSVRQFVKSFAARHGRLHVLLNCAGLLRVRRTLTVDGFETTFAVNHLGPFLLTNLLRPLLEAGAPSWVVTVSSEFHRWVRMDFDDLHGARRYGPLTAYARSKLANILFTVELSRRLAGTGVTANALHPGLARTNMGKGNGLRWALTARPFFYLMSSPERAARAPVYLATAPDVATVTGRYFIRRRESAPSRAAREEEAQRRLWEVSCALTGIRG